jgi:anti-sigma factor RsiW
MLNDDDLDLLESYLDDALSATDVERLDRRLTGELELSGALDQLRRERAARIAFFQSQTPDQPVSDRFANNVIVSLHRRERQLTFVRGGRIAGALAACLFIGFAVGWIEHGGAVPHSQIAAPTDKHPDARLVVHSPKPAEAGQFQVAILDENGKVIALQRFNKIEDARQFADDLAQYQVRRQQVQDGQAMLVSDKF